MRCPKRRATGFDDRKGPVLFLAPRSRNDDKPSEGGCQEMTNRKWVFFLTPCLLLRVPAKVRFCTTKTWEHPTKARHEMLSPQKGFGQQSTAVTNKICCHEKPQKCHSLSTPDNELPQALGPLLQNLWRKLIMKHVQSLKAVLGVLGVNGRRCSNAEGVGSRS